MAGGGGGSTTTNIHSVIIDAINRARGGAGAPGINGDYRVTGDTSNADIENELIKKYEESIERNIELESRGDDAQRKIAELEAELRRTKERLNDTQTALRKLHDMSQDLDTTTGEHKRTRSLSPGKLRSENRTQF